MTTNAKMNRPPFPISMNIGNADEAFGSDLARYLSSVAGIPQTEVMETIKGGESVLSRNLQDVFHSEAFIAMVQDAFAKTVKEVEDHRKAVREQYERLPVVTGTIAYERWERDNATTVDTRPFTVPPAFVADYADKLLSVMNEETDGDYVAYALNLTLAWSGPFTLHIDEDEGQLEKFVTGGGEDRED